VSSVELAAPSTMMWSMGGDVCAIEEDGIHRGVSVVCELSHVWGDVKVVLA
jgi:hypothetical protein